LYEHTLKKISIITKSIRALVVCVLDGSSVKMVRLRANARTLKMLRLIELIGLAFSLIFIAG